MVYKCTTTCNLCLDGVIGIIVAATTFLFFEKLLMAPEALLLARHHLVLITGCIFLKVNSSEIVFLSLFFLPLSQEVRPGSILPIQKFVSGGLGSLP